MFFDRNYRPQIGVAWQGKHVVVLRCNLITNQVLTLHHSLHAPTEPAHHNCAETLATYLSIGYVLTSTIPLQNNEILYILVKE